MPRIAQQAAYVRGSNADVVLLQEVCGVSMLDAIVSRLDGWYEAHYVRVRRKPIALLAWLLFTLCFATLQFLLLEPFLQMALAPNLLALASPPTRFVTIVVLHVWRWRHSLISQYLLGTVGGQLAVLRRTSSANGDSPNVACPAAEHASFTPFDETFTTGTGFRDLRRDLRHRCKERCKRLRDRGLRRRRKPHHTATDAPQAVAAPMYLESFFNLRHRGMLRVTFPLATSGDLHVVNTHLPHCNDNTSLLKGVGEALGELAMSGTVVLGGDFNPLPDRALPAQFEPLLDAGFYPTSDLGKVRPHVLSSAPLPSTPTAPTARTDQLVHPPVNSLAMRSEATTMCAAGALHTWDLAQPLTRYAQETCGNMQLDFVSSLPGLHPLHWPSLLEHTFWRMPAVLLWRMPAVLPWRCDLFSAVLCRLRPLRPC